jgi:hypothetical protein
MNEKDNRTVLGKTLNSLLDQCGLPVSRLEDLCASLVKKKCAYFRVPDTQQWRLPLLQELMKIRAGQLLLGNLDSQETNDIIEYLCIS